MRVDYILYYEHVERELDSLLILKNKLKEYNLSGVILPIHYNIYKNILKYSPKVIILPFLYDWEDSFIANAYRKLDSNTIIFDLHSEQIGNNDFQDFMLPKKVKDKNIYHFVWGEFFYKLLISNGIKENNVFITGSIRNDLIFNKIGLSYQSNKVLIPTSFSLTFASEDYITNIIKSRGLDKDKFIETVSFHKKTRDAFFEEIYLTSLNLKNYQFILRPHPYVDINEYTKYFLFINKIDMMPKNIIIERSRSIAEAMVSCEYIIGWNSTSLLEGSILKKKVIQLIPFEIHSGIKMDFQNMFPICKNHNELIDLLTNYYEFSNDIGVKNYINNVYSEIDGKVADRMALRIHEILNNIYKNKSKHINFKFKLFLIYKVITIDLPKTFLHKMGLLHKFKLSYRGILNDNREYK